MSDLDHETSTSFLSRRGLLRCGAGMAAAACLLRPDEAFSAAPVIQHDLAYKAQWLGTHLYAGNLGNTTYTERHAYRIRCELSGSVGKIRWMNQFNLSRSGYHSGNGGRISVEIQTDNAGLPSGKVLGKTAIMGPALDLGRRPLVSFISPISLVDGQTYHIVFRQHAPNEGWLSVDDLDTSRPPPNFAYSAWPFLQSRLVSLKYRNGQYSAWAQRTPIYELHYTNGKIKGQGYILGGRSHTGDIDGARTARQELIMTLPNARAQAVSFVVYRTTSSGGNLTVQLKNSGGTNLTQVVVPRSSIVQTAGDSGSNPAMKWVTVALPGQPLLTQGQRYYINFSAPTGSAYRVMPIQRGNVFAEYREDKLSTVGSAGYSTNNGVSWTYWPTSWSSNPDRSWSLPALVTLGAA